MAKKPASRNDLLKGAAMLFLLYGNKRRAWRETAGINSEAANDSAAQAFFDSPNAKRSLKEAEIEFESLLDKHLAAYAKKKGLFFPSEEAIGDANARMEIIQKNLEAGIRSKDDVLLELNELITNTTDPILKRDYYKMYIDATNLKKSDDMSEIQQSVIILPEKNNIVINGYELHIASDKKQRFIDDIKKNGATVG